MKKITHKHILLNALKHPQIKSRFSDKLLQRFELFKFKKGDFIIRQGYCSDYLYFIIDGKARVYTYTSGGNITLLSFCEGYELLGDSASLWGKDAVANVEAISDGFCIGISLLQYRDELLQDVTFLRSTCEALSDKLNESNTIVANIFLGSIEARLAFYILNTAREDIFTSNLSECATIMRTSYRHLLRVLNMFCENDMLKKEGKSYIILNREALRKIAFEIE